MQLVLRSEKYRWAAGAAFLLIMHSVGLFGLLFSGQPELFQSLTPVNLLVCTAVVLAFHTDWSPAFFWFALITFGVGYSVEVLGVHTGWPFGTYAYGSALGWKVLDVPLLIGLNWFMLVYCSGMITERLAGPRWLKVVAGALLLLGLDVLLEPVAMRYDFWDWPAGAVPLRNYLGWLGVALLLHTGWQLAPFRKNNPLAWFLFALQCGFFLILSRA